jgi:hypothetical protein
VLSGHALQAAQNAQRIAYATIDQDSIRQHVVNVVVDDRRVKYLCHKNT